MKNKVFLAVTMLTAMLFTACEGLDLNKTERYDAEGMYVGITAFSDNVSYSYPYHSGEVKGRYRYSILDAYTTAGHIDYINGLQMGDATVLYYAVDENLSYLQKCKFPNNLSSVNIVTFTDGLNQGSRALDKQNGNHDYASSDESYVAEIHRKIETEKVQGLPVNAYAIGIRGKDVAGDAAAVFKDNLLKLSSSDANAIEVSNMDEVSVKFKEIAASLYKTSESTTLTIIIPMPSDNEKERFTFDDVTDATASQCYLEGVYVNGAMTNITYVGCSSTSGARVVEKAAGGVKIQFTFENFADESGQAISTQHMQQWHMSPGQSTWTRNSEFRPEESTQTHEERKTAVVMLILDCSSSLGSDFTKVKKAANDFIKTLAGETVDNPGTDPGTDPGTGTTYYIKHPWGSGSDESWTWQTMTKISDSYYEYTGLWGGLGANINTKPEDSGAAWYSESEINGASSLSIGDQVKFGYYPVTGTLKVRKISGGSSSNVAKVRFQKENAYEWLLAMSVDQFNGTNVTDAEWVQTLAEYEFGTSSGTSPYYEIPAGNAVLLCYVQEDTEEESGWVYLPINDNFFYYFAGGKKYTYSIGDNGEEVVWSVTIDGSFNAPSQVVYQKRVRKSDLIKAPMVRR